jgi:hypothetical protein
MPDANSRALQPGRHRPWARITGRLVLDVLRRVYAAGIIVLVLWLSYQAIRYLIITLMYPAPPAAQITEIPKRLTEAMLETRRTQWPGVVEIENPRTPLAHYHRLAGWIEPDRFDSCTQSGCHAPVPHARRKEVRAFLNMHATSLHCAVCHLDAHEQPLPTVWYDLASGKRRAAPDALRTYGWLTSDEGRQELAGPTASTQKNLVELLRGVARESDDVPALTQLAEHVAAVRYDSAAFQQLVETARTTLPRHFRGEYGAKLTLLDPQSQRAVLANPGTEAAIRAFLRESQTAEPARKGQLLGAVHPNLRANTLHCTNCHTATGGLLDFAAAGYPPARREALTQPAIFKMIEHIASGQPFELPGFIRPEEPAATKPVQQPQRPTSEPVEQP